MLSPMVKRPPYAQIFFDFFKIKSTQLMPGKIHINP